MVERPRILTVKDMLLQKRLLTTEQAMDKSTLDDIYIYIYICALFTYANFLIKLKDIFKITML